MGDDFDDSAGPKVFGDEVLRYLVGGDQGRRERSPRRVAAKAA